VQSGICVDVWLLTLHDGSATSDSADDNVHCCYRHHNVRHQCLQHCHSPCRSLGTDWALLMGWWPWWLCCTTLQ